MPPSSASIDPVVTRQAELSFRTRLRNWLQPRSWSGFLVRRIGAGAVTARWKVAFRLGSSQDGMKRRASEFSNWV